MVFHARRLFNPFRQTYTGILSCDSIAVSSSEEILSCKSIGYILVFACIVLVIRAGFIISELLPLHLQLGLQNPDLAEDERLFNARFLYSISPAYLDGYPERKSAVREEIVDKRLGKSAFFDDKTKSREKLMAILVAAEQKSSPEEQSPQNLDLSLIITLIIGVLGIHFIAKFVTTRSWRRIGIVRPIPVFSIGFGVLALFAFLISSMLGTFKEIYGPWGYFAPVFGYVLVLLLIGQYMRARGSDLWREIGLVDINYRKAIKVGVVGFLVFVPLQIIINTQGLVMSYLLGLSPAGHPFVEEFLETSSVRLRLMIAALVMLSAPFFEEVFFRGIFLQSLQQRLSPTLACVLCGLAFGLVHGSFLSVFVIFFLGVHLAFLMQKTGSVITPIVVHLLFNTHSIIQVLLLK